MDFTFRTARPADGADAERILRAAFTPYVRRLGREIPADNYAGLPEEIEGGDIYVAEAAGAIVGVATTKRRDGGLYLRQLAVDPAQQRTGLGSFMLIRLEELARACGDKTLTLETAEMMDHLVRLYRRHGLEIVRRGPPDHGRDAHPRVFMEKKLGP